MRTDFVFTSESVTGGHPDKLCDWISDAVVDRFLERDPFTRVIAEAAVATGVVFIAARFVSRASVDIPEVTRSVIDRAGYRDPDFNPRDCTILTRFRELPGGEYSRVDEESLSDEALDRLPAGNQVNVFGFACRQTESFLPLPIWVGHRLASRLAGARHSSPGLGLYPDGKIQVGVEYRDRRPVRIHSVSLIAAQRQADHPSPAALHEALTEEVVRPVLADSGLTDDSHTNIYVNPAGPFIGGGPAAHSGMTGRKNAIDTYGEYSRHSGAALSGKDPSRIDRIGAYAARHAAKNVVAAGLAGECEVQLSYTVGLSRPVSIQVETFGTGRLEDGEIARRLEAVLDFRPGGILRRFGLRHLPQARAGDFFQELAVYGHMGRPELELPWEEIEEAEALR
ncbi:methionine adenosyltransferase [Thiohalorhabdus methylotrophus]|uniref:Methionine adenosyltransferase n=1 Tax=Thiohalorhabdus methylotrophus TaxID=3242694 RepID=A0ABV4TQQ5_9GAMM